jgi:hypothetical protein
MQSMFKLLLVLFLLMCLPTLTSSIDKVAKKLDSVSNKIKKQNKNIKTTKNPTLSIDDVKNGFKPDYLTPVFTNLKEAKKYFNYFNKDASNVLVAFDVKINNKIVKNWFVSDTIKELYKFILQNPNAPLYEQINTNKHKLFFDVDINKGDKEFDTFNFPQYKQQIEKELRNALFNKLNFVWLNSSSEIKHSYHLIVSNISCNIKQNQQIKNYLNKQLKSHFLDNVYGTNQCLRLWGCSKYGQNRPLRLISPKCSFCDTLVNIYPNDQVVLINAKIPFEEELSNQTQFSNIIAANVPNNAYLMDNFKQSKKSNVYNRKFKNMSLPCPICISPKDLCKEKHHKTTDVYIFKCKDKTFMGCFRAKQWLGDRYFLNLETNKVEYVPKRGSNNISPTIVSSITTYKKGNINNVDKDILELLELDVNFGKYKNKKLKDMFKDMYYVDWVCRQKWKGELKPILEKIINYFNNIKSPSPLKAIKPKTPQSVKPSVKEMVNVISSRTGTNPTLWSNMTKTELEMHYSLLNRYCNT